jgi:predicted hydrolase (HD superfamily)
MIITEPTREEAFKLFKAYNKSESLTKHALAVEGVMVHFATMAGENPMKWGIIGLLHDLDYEQYPEQHCVKTTEILTGLGWPADYIRAIESHGWGICTDTEPLQYMEKVLYAIDELTGLVTTSVLVRPDKDLSQLTVTSVIKKWKDKRFAAGVNRDVIQKGAVMLNMELEALIDETIKGMQKIAEVLGLPPS